jgi:hypothetical protein
LFDQAGQCCVHFIRHVAVELALDPASGTTE